MERTRFRVDGFVSASPSYEIWVLSSLSYVELTLITERVEKIKRAREQMAMDQTEIEQLRIEGRAVIARPGRKAASITSGMDQGASLV